MRVLVTGGCGNLGSHAVQACLAAGHEVRVVDLPTKGNQKGAVAFGGQAEIRWDDLRDADMAILVEGCDAVIHTAFVLWPISEHDPARAEVVNVDATARLLAACTGRSPNPRFVFASSIAVFGYTQSDPPPRQANDPTSPVDVYSRTKVRAEQLVQESGLPWVILRLGVAPPIRPTQMSSELLKQLFRIRPDNRMEFLHPADAGLALARAAEEPDATGKILLIGGGEQNQLRALDFNNGVFQVAGLGHFKARDFGRDDMYTDWLDTNEAQKILDFQRHSFADYLTESRAAMGPLPLLVKPLAPVLRRMLVAGFAPKRSERASA